MQVNAPSKKSIRAFAYEISDVYNAGITKDDSRLSLSQLETFSIREAAAVIKDLALRDKLLGQKPDEALYVTYKCLPIEDDCDYTCNCKDEGGALKSVTLPKMLYINGEPQIAYFGLTDFSLDFRSVNSIVQGDRLVVGVIGLKVKPMYWISKNKAYIILPKGFELIEDVTIVVIPQDADSGSNETCNDIWINDWDIPSHVKALVWDRVLGKLLPSYMAYKPNRDFRNNNNDGNQIASTYKQSNQP